MAAVLAVVAGAFLFSSRMVGHATRDTSVDSGSRSANPSQVQALSKIPYRQNSFIRSSHKENAA